MRRFHQPTEEHRFATSARWREVFSSETPLNRKKRKHQLIELHLPSRQGLLTLDPSFFFIRIIFDVEAISVFGGSSFLRPSFERKILTFIQLLNLLVNVRQAHAEKFFARIYFVHLQC